jgi:radical SAM superfamily enzyme YgiQ (UPF0313 family)
MMQRSMPLDRRAPARLPASPRIAFVQPGQLVPRDALDALHSFNVSTTGLAILGALRDAGYPDVHFLDVACEQGDLFREWNESLHYKGMPDGDVDNWLRALGPDVVCITSMFTSDFPATDHMCSLVRRALPDALVVVGGRHASLMPHWHLENPAVDLLVQGEGEQTIVAVIDALTGRSEGVDVRRLPGVFTSATVQRGSPKAWPEAKLGGTFAWDKVLLKPDRSFRYKEVVLHNSPKDFLYKQAATSLHSAPLLATRGCPLACRFCGSHFTPDMRPVGVDRLFDDIVWAHDQGVRIFYNISENFCLGEEDRELVRRLVDFRARKNGDLVITNPNSTFLPVYMKGKEPDREFIELLRAAGTDLITISVETFSPRFDDKKLFKRYSIPQVETLWRTLREVGFKVHLYMMTGFPGQTVPELLHDVNQIRDWVERGLIDAASWSNLLYLPGTPYYNEAIAQGRFDEATFRQWIQNGFNFFAVPERFNFSEVPTPFLREVLAKLRLGQYDMPRAA